MPQNRPILLQELNYISTVRHEEIITEKRKNKWRKNKRKYTMVMWNVRSTYEGKLESYIFFEKLIREKKWSSYFSGREAPEVSIRI
jgi:hypothetical protein